MDLFGNKKLKEENSRLKAEIRKCKTENSVLRKENSNKEGIIKFLEDLCKELMSDGLRNGSSLAGRYMADRKKRKE